MSDQEYSGWKNYETWNIALHINNDERLYTIAKRCPTYTDFLVEMAGIGLKATPDRVLFLSDKPDIKALTELVASINNQTKGE